MTTLSTKLRDSLDRFYHRKARLRAIDEFRRSLALIVDLDALEASVATRLKEIFDPDRLVILRLDPAQTSYRPSLISGIDAETAEGVQFAADGRLASWFRVNQGGLSFHRGLEVVEYLTPEERGWLERLDIDLAAPLLAQNRLLGMLLLGADPRRRRLGTREDRLLLERLAAQTSLAFQTAILYQEQQNRLERLHRADRLAAMGQLAAGVAHEIRNPLTAIRSTMQYLSGGFPQDSPKRELVEELIDEVDRIDGTIKDLLGLTRPADFQPTAVDLVATLDQAIQLLRIQAKKQDVKIEGRFAESSTVVQVDPNQIKQVVYNLILNALQAMREGGTIRLAVDRVAGEEELVRIRVIDDGPGIPAKQLAKVKDPFFTTKQEGTGLGLAICQGIIERHGGELKIESAEGEGVTVSIFLPLGEEDTS